MRQFIAVAAIAAIAAAQSGNQLNIGDTRDQIDGTINGEWAATVEDGNRAMYKTEDVDVGNSAIEQDRLNKSIYGVDANGNAKGEEKSGDGETRPLCNIGGFENQIDNQGPSDQCCRIYEYSLYKGRFMDFCIQEDLDNYCSVHA